MEVTQSPILQKNPVDVQPNVPKKNKKNKHSQIDLNVNPMRKLQKLFRYSSVRETDWSLLTLFNQSTTMLIPHPKYTVYQFKFPQGAYLIKSFLSKQQQLRISQQALNEFVQKPYRTNLSQLKGLYPDESESSGPDEVQDPKEAPQSQPQNKQQHPNEYTFDQKIRWSNLGYNYDWTNRKYPSTKSNIPEIIDYISNKANTFFTSTVVKKQRMYTAQSVIVNYYKERDAMTSHLDDAEEDQDSPIYSFAFGLSCVFLIGDTHKDAEPLAVRLDSGDLFVMSGHSRICYHGVPRVIAGTYNPNFDIDINHLDTNSKSGPNTIKNTLNYLQKHRININIRQVYRKD